MDIKQFTAPLEVVARVIDYRYLPTGLVWLSLAIDSLNHGACGIDLSRTDTITLTTNSTDLPIETAQLVTVKYDGIKVVSVEVLQ